MRAPWGAATAILTLILAAACHGNREITAPGESALAARGGKSGPATGTVDVSGAFTAAAQPVEIVNDGARKLELHAQESVFQSTIDLASTITAGTAGCVTDPASVPESRKAELLARMADALQNRFFNLTYDRQRPGAPSEMHQAAHTWSEADGKLFSLRIGSAPALQPGNFATITEVSAGVFVVTGGAARIVDRTGSVKNHVYMACPNLDQVTIALVRR
jgi:hypothetical protein